MVSTMIVLSCLSRETKKFHKRLSKEDNKEDLVGDLRKLERLMASYVQQFLGQGLLDRLAQTDNTRKEDIRYETLKKNSFIYFSAILFRAEIKQWFTVRAKELESMNYTEKNIKRIILAAIRTGLTKHPLDLRGSRRALEAAKLFLEVDTKKERLNFLNTSILLKGASKEGESETAQGNTNTRKQEHENSNNAPPDIGRTSYISPPASSSPLIMEGQVTFLFIPSPLIMEGQVTFLLIPSPLITEGHLPHPPDYVRTRYISPPAATSPDY